MKLLKWILKLGTLNRRRIYFGEIPEWEDRIRKLGDPSMMNKGENEYILEPNTSVGVGEISGPFIGKRRLNIRVFAKLNLIEPGKYHVHFTSPFRTEHFFIAGGGILFMVAFAITKAEPWMLFLMPVFWIGSHIWFYFIYSAQEEWVVEELTKRLRLYKVKRWDK